MKKFTKFFVAMSLVAATLFTVSSCSEDPEVDPNSQVDPSEPTEEVLPTISSATVQEESLTDTYAAIDVVYANGDAIYYNYYESGETTEDWKSVSVDTDSTSATIEISGLTAESEYKAEIYVVNGEYASETLTVSFTTAAATNIETISVSNVVAGALMITADVVINPAVCEGFAIYSTNTAYYYEDYFWSDFTYGYCTTVTESGTVTFGSDYYLSNNTAYTLVFAAYTTNSDGTYSVVDEIITIESATTAATVGASDATIELTIDDSQTSLTGFGGSVYRNDEIGGYYFGYMATTDAPNGAEAWITSTGWLSGYSAYAYSFVDYVYNYETYMSYPEVVDVKSVTATNLIDGTEYIAFAIPVDLNGNLGKITTTTVTTSTLATDESIKPIVTVTPHETTADFVFEFNGCDKVFHMHAEANSSWTTAETAYSYFLNDLTSMYYGWSSSSSEVVDGKISHTESWLAMGTSYNMYYLGVAADGTLGVIQTLNYTTSSPEYTSSASLNIAVTGGQAYYAYGLDYPDYLYAEVNFSVEMTNGAVSYLYGTFDKAYIMNQNSMEAWGDYLIGSCYNTTESTATELIGVYLGTKDYVLVAVAIDADGAYGTPMYLGYDGWDNPIEPEDNGGDEGGVDPM